MTGERTASLAAARVGIAFAGALLCSTIASAQQSPRIAGLLRDVAAGHAGAVKGFWSDVAKAGSPLVEHIGNDDSHVLATFVWKDRGDTKSVVVAARLFSADPATEPRNRMRHVAGTNVWYLTARLPRDAEVLYQLWINLPDSGAGASALPQRFAQPDPLNSLTYPEKDDSLYDAGQPWRIGSIARMPGVPINPWLATMGGIAHGTFSHYSIASTHLSAANPRNVWVYATPGTLSLRPNVLVLFDGNTTYQKRIPTVAIVDNLFAAHQIGPTVVIFVDNGGQARGLDLNFSDAFLAFVADELLPWVQREYHFSAEPAYTALGGDSLCGLFAAFAALRRPDVFGEVLGQSAAMQFNNIHDGTDGNTPQWIVRQFERSPKLSVKFYLEVGLMEDRALPGNDVTLLSSNRRLRDVLAAKGYDVRYREVYADHDPLHWRRTLPDALIALFPVR